MVLESVTIIEGHFLAGIAFVIVAGFMIGYERATRGDPAGVRTHTLVCLGSMLMAVLSNHIDPNPARLATNVIVGIGFIGAGLIMHKGKTVHGITSAASIWVIAAIGLAVGYRYYLIAVITTATAFIILRLPHIGEHKLPANQNSYFKKMGPAERTSARRKK